MTVSYSNKVATITAVGIFWKLLLRWRGSIYKLIWRELIVFAILYYLLRLLYEYGLDPEQQKSFELVVKYCRSYSTSIPLSFVLGFYVNLVMRRWWDQFTSLPWPDNMGVLVSSLIEGHDERGRLMRRSVLRYINLSYVIALAEISPRVKERFPNNDAIVEEGYMNQTEREILESFEEDVPHNLYWMPLVWASTIVVRARREGRIKGDFAVKAMMDNILRYRTGLEDLMGYHHISIPLVYTQVVTLAVYSFFAGTLLASQYVDVEGTKIDLVVPWFTFLQYLFYVGWLKVAETLVNPFGTDDDDFEINALIDRNFKIGYVIVDGMHDRHPELLQDKYWDDVIPGGKNEKKEEVKKPDETPEKSTKPASNAYLQRIVQKAFSRRPAKDSGTNLADELKKTSLEEGGLDNPAMDLRGITEIIVEREDSNRKESANGTHNVIPPPRKNKTVEYDQDTDDKGDDDGDGGDD